MSKRNLSIFGVVVFIFLITVHSVSAQGTTFTYQGQLQSSGGPANGKYDFTFALYNNTSTNTGQIGTTQTDTNVGVTNGLFLVSLNFGSVFGGNATWLAIGVRTNGGTTFTALNPLQELTPTPYAMYSASAGSAATAGSATVAGTADAVAAANITGSLSTAQLPGFQSSSNYTATGGGLGYVNAGTVSTIGGGLDNFINGNGVYATVGGGNTNKATAYAATVAGGQQNNAAGENSTVGGGVLNQALGSGAVVAGGGYNGTNIGNIASGTAATIGGGVGNTNGGNYSTTGGGYYNTNNGIYATIGGGYFNSNSGTYETIGGGYDNLNTGSYATIPGGSANIASGIYSFAAGQEAHATNQGAFVWADSMSGAYSSTNNDTFNVRARGGISAVTSGAGMSIDGSVRATAFTGNGTGLTNLNGAQLYSGTTPLLRTGSGSSFYFGLGAGNSPAGQQDTGFGTDALSANTSGASDTALGMYTLTANTTGSDNTGVGLGALYLNKTASDNTAVGYAAMNSSTGAAQNVAVGSEALENLGSSGTGGSGDIAVGYGAGLNFNANESGNIDIGNAGVAGENNVIRIGTSQSTAYIAGAINGNGSGLSGVNAITLGGGDLSTLDGENGLGLGTNLFLNNNPIYLRNDMNHGLGYNGLGITNFPNANVQPDGPVLWGYTGGALGTLSSGAQAALTWNASSVNVSNSLNVAGNTAISGTLSAANTPGVNYSQSVGESGGITLANDGYVQVDACGNHKPSAGYFVVTASVSCNVDSDSSIDLFLYDTTSGQTLLTYSSFYAGSGTQGSITCTAVVPVTTGIGGYENFADTAFCSGSDGYVSTHSLVVMFFPRLNN